LQRIDAGVERSVLYFTQGLHPAITAIAHDGPCRLRALLKRSQANLICIGKTGFFTADGTNTDALIDVVRAIFNNAVF